MSCTNSLPSVHSLYFCSTSLSARTLGWKKLLQDHNSKNGICRLQLNTVSFSRRNTNQSFCVSMMQSMAWDRRRNHVILEVEAFGEDDFTEASGTTINCSTLQKLWPWCMSCENNGPSHELRRLGLSVELFSPDCEHTFGHGLAVEEAQEIAEHAHSCPCPTAIFSPCPSCLHWDCHVICKHNQSASVLLSFCHLEVLQLPDSAGLFHPARC
jgi:hypothetical protein